MYAVFTVSPAMGWSQMFDNKPLMDWGQTFPSNSKEAKELAVRTELTEDLANLKKQQQEIRSQMERYTQETAQLKREIERLTIERRNFDEFEQRRNARGAEPDYDHLSEAQVKSEIRKLEQKLESFQADDVANQIRKTLKR